MIRLRPVLFLCLTLASAVCAAAGGERLLVNAQIFTADPARPYAEAVALRGDRVLAVGNRNEASAALGKDAELIDLGGNFLMPGLIDSHCHAVSGGMGLISADNADQARSVEELARFVAEAKTSGRGMSGDVLVVSGVALRIWNEVAQLSARFDAGDYAAQPLVLAGMDGHTAWANRAMRVRAGIDRQSIAGLAPAARALYGQDANGEPNGLLAEAAIARVTSLVPQPDAARMLEAGRAAVRYLHAAGITAWLDPYADDATLAAYRGLSEARELGARVVALPPVDFAAGEEAAQLAAALRQREAFRGVTDVRIGGIKVFADGVAEFPTQTAHLSQPYRNSGRNGELLFDPARFARIAVEADRQGMIVHVHAIGDQAVTEALDGIAAARSANGNSGVPHSITHLQFIRPDDIPRFRALGVLASFQLYWARGADTTIDLVKPYLDPALYAWQYPARALLDAGGTIAGGSDWSVSTPNVFHALYRAETRNGPLGVLDAGQRVPREAMLHAYTRNAAQALGEQERIGSIAPGKLADLVLLDRDMLTVSAEDARDARVLWTVVGGDTVFGSAPAR